MKESRRLLTKKCLYFKPLNRSTAQAFTLYFSLITHVRELQDTLPSHCLLLRRQLSLCHSLFSLTSLKVTYWVLDKQQNLASCLQGAAGTELCTQHWAVGREKSSRSSSEQSEEQHEACCHTVTILPTSKLLAAALVKLLFHRELGNFRMYSSSMLL